MTSAVGKGYKRPPITEAIIDLHFENLLDDRDLERLRREFGRHYPTAFNNWQIGFQLKPDGSVTAKAEQVGFRGNSEDGGSTLIVQRGSIASIRMAPYRDWVDLEALAARNVETMRELVGYRKFNRIGVRFVNRIDIPIAEVLGKPLTATFNV